MSTRKFIKKLTASLLFIAVVMSFGVQSAFAESNSPKATVKNNVVTFSNLDQLKANEKLAIAVVDSNGDPATITIESVDNSISRVAKSSNSWKVSYKGVVIQARKLFWMRCMKKVLFLPIHFPKMLSAHIFPV